MSRQDKYWIICHIKGILPRKIRQEIQVNGEMQDYIMVTGIVIKAEPIGEYDRRVVLLTKEKGKISAFARAARKAGNRLMAPSNPFSFGQFRLYAGRNSYTMAEADISNYFEELRQDFIGAYYGMYFLEICDYYARENNDELEMLKLLYQSLRALTNHSIPHKLTRCIFELKAIMVNGEFDGRGIGYILNESTQYTIDYIMKTPSEKLYRFLVSEEVLKELVHFCRQLCRLTFDRDFKSLEILENLE